MRFDTLYKNQSPDLASTQLSAESVLATAAEIDAGGWEALNAGDVVEVKWRSSPYPSKWAIARSGAVAPAIIAKGLRNANGERPVISGGGASTRSALEYWNSVRVTDIGFLIHPY